ncbi:MAG: T9SS type A sorting domain-containing protein [Bacteroidales bacterium]|nr:T9SS type A sorting domain-containing protein [Bacteroidales bacterium]
MTKHIFAILILLFVSITAKAQEILTMPAYNPAIANQYQLKRSAAITTTTEVITLPFYDDFSEISVFPSPLRWADSSAFINTDYAKYPPSVGVVSLDALTQEGALYTNAGPNPFDADNLTSLPIRLDSVFSPSPNAITPADSVFLSFYYQPQGRSISPPTEKSSLILEFYAPVANDTVHKWDPIWLTEGGVSVDAFATANGNYFKQVLIPVTDTSYFKNGFRFRFRNIAALAGNSQADWRSNGSLWNIDVVSLATGGSKNGIHLEDVTFGDQAPSMLVNYEAMPFRQYAKNFTDEMKDTLDIKIANLDTIAQSRTYKYSISKNSLAPFKEYNGSPYTVNPFLTDGYLTYAPWARPAVNFFFDPTTIEKNLVFHITHSLSPDPESKYRSNDTIRFTQVFSNYYAYDNGTSEAGIGINGAAGSYAVQFKLNLADTLRGMQIYFNPVIGGSNQKAIDLKVWNDSNGKPGRIVKTLGGVTPLYTSKLNEFNTYWFDTPMIVDGTDFPGLIFYIGWSQSFVDNLNVGFDRYKDSHIRRFFNVNGYWEMSTDTSNYGSLMFRPIVGPVDPLGVEKPLTVEHLSIQPNPVTDGNLIIRLPETWTENSNNDINISIFSATGSRVLAETFNNPVNVSTLAPGFYMVILSDENNGRKATGKLIIR